SAESVFSAELISSGLIEGAAVVPDQPGFLILGRFGIEVVVDRREVSGFGDVHAPSMADAWTPFRILSSADKDFVVLHNRGSHDIVARAPAAGLVDRRFGIAIELP